MLRHCYHIVICFLLGLISTVHGQTISSYTFPVGPVHTGASLNRTTLALGPLNDEFLGGVPLGFNFPYGDTVYNKIGISVDGYVILDAPSGSYHGGPGQAYVAGSSGTGCALSSPQARPLTIAVFNRDMFMGSGGRIEIQYPQPTAWGGVVIFRWRGLKVGSQTDSLTFELTLNEWGQIMVNYSPSRNQTLANALDFQFGLIGKDTSDYLVFEGEYTGPGSSLGMYYELTPSASRRGLCTVNPQHIDRGSYFKLFRPGLGFGYDIQTLGHEEIPLAAGCGPLSARQPLSIRVANIGTRPASRIYVRARAQAGINGSTYTDAFSDSVDLNPPLQPGDTTWITTASTLNLSYTAEGYQIGYRAFTQKELSVQWDTVLFADPVPGDAPPLTVAQLPFQHYNDNLPVGTRTNTRLYRDDSRRTGESYWSAYYWGTSQRPVVYCNTATRTFFEELNCLDLASLAASPDSLVFEGRAYPRCTIVALFSRDGGITYNEADSVQCDMQLYRNQRDSGYAFRIDASRLLGSPQARLAFMPQPASFSAQTDEVHFPYLAVRQGGRRVVATRPRYKAGIQLGLYPNPARGKTGQITVRLESDGPATQSLSWIEVTDASGRLLYRTRAHGTQSQIMPGLAPGLYLVRAGLAQGPILIQRLAVE